MKKCYLDSNILVYLKNEDVLEHGKTVSFLEQLIRSETHLFISPLVLDEFLHSIRLALLMSKNKNAFPLLKSSFDDILDLPLLSIVNPPSEIVSQKKIVGYMEKYFLRPRDAYHLLIMVSNGIDHFATYDYDFEKIFKSGLLKRGI